MKKNIILLLIAIVSILGFFKLDRMGLRGYAEDAVADKNHERGYDLLLKYLKIKGHDDTGKVIYFYPEEKRDRFLKEARIYLEIAVKRDHENARYHEHYGWVLKFQKEYDSALKEYEKAYEIDKNKIDYFYNVYAIYDETGDTSKAEMYEEKYITVAKESDHPMHIERVIFLLAAKKRFDEAREQIQRARESSSYIDKEELDFMEEMIDKEEQSNIENK